jgi:hypothetical protein
VTPSSSYIIERLIQSLSFLVLSFTSPRSDYDYSLSPEPLITASGLPDCDCRSIQEQPKPTDDGSYTQQQDDDDEYIPCAHFYPEFWGEPTQAIEENQVRNNSCSDNNDTPDEK